MTRRKKKILYLLFALTEIGKISTMRIDYR